MLTALNIIFYIKNSFRILVWCLEEQEKIHNFFLLSFLRPFLLVLLLYFYFSFASSVKMLSKQREFLLKTENRSHNDRVADFGQSLFYILIIFCVFFCFWRERATENMR